MDDYDCKMDSKCVYWSLDHQKNETKICKKAYSVAEGDEIGWHAYHHEDLVYENGRELGKVCETGLATKSGPNVARCDTLDDVDPKDMQCKPFYIAASADRRVRKCKYGSKYSQETLRVDCGCSLSGENTGYCSLPSTTVLRKYVNAMKTLYP